MVQLMPYDRGGVPRVAWTWLIMGLCGAPACVPATVPTGPGEGPGMGVGVVNHMPRPKPATSGRQVVIGEMCPLGAAGRPGLAPIAMRSVQWSDTAADIANVIERGGVPRFADDTVWVDARERDTAALLCLSERGGGGAGVAAAARAAAAREYLSAVLADSGAAERRIGAWQAARSDVPGAWDGLLGGEARAALAERHPFFAAEMHPTRLERYIDCPFAFLLRDVLRLDAPDEPNDTLEMDAREFGTLAHKILFETYERVISEELPLAGALDAVDAAWQSCCAHAERRGVTGAVLSWEVRRDMLHEDLRESVRRDPVFTFDDWRPVNVEWRFGESHDRPVVLDLGDGRQVRFAGRVDRVDATPAGACVIDYKTGAGNAEKGRIKDGLSVQLPVYQLAVRQAGDGGVAAVASLYRSITRRGGFGDLPLLQDEETSAARLGDLVRAAAELVDAGMFPRTARGRCDYCDVRYACGVSPWARDRKRRHEALHAVRELQSSGPKADKSDEGADDAS